jgi:hypothetical protein
MSHEHRRYSDIILDRWKLWATILGTLALIMGWLARGADFVRASGAEEAIARVRIESMSGQLKDLNDWRKSHEEYQRAYMENQSTQFGRMDSRLSRIEGYLEKIARRQVDQ